jgi:tetratricopeptide (TPR) repeat protein
MPAAPQAAAQAAPPVRNAPAPEPARPEPKVSTADQKAKAGRLIGLGDANFAKQKYFPAIDRYKSAAQMAADLPEPFFRQAFAMVAVGQYENAAKAFRRGLKIRSDWSNSPFRLDQLYEGGALAKTSHFETLAKAVEANPLDSDLLLVLGMQLFFDGHPERAGVFFTRVAQLGGNADRLLDDFLAKPAPAGAVGAKGQRAGKIVF